MTDLLMLAQQSGSSGASATGIFRFFAAVFLIMSFYIGAWSFTYWISKDE